MNNETVRYNQQHLLEHDCILKGRKHVDITGVKEVVSFDSSSVVLVTDCGELTLEGNEIKVGTLDTDRGVVAVDGKICALYYSDESKRGRTRLFGREKG